MKWYYTTQGPHVRVRVFMNGAKCGELCFRKEEFEQIHRNSLLNVPGECPVITAFIPEGKAMEEIQQQLMNQTL